MVETPTSAGSGIAYWMWTVVEVKGSHSVYVSKPEEVAALIETAARGMKLAKS